MSNLLPITAGSPGLNGIDTSQFCKPSLSATGRPSNLTGPFAAVQPKTIRATAPAMGQRETMQKNFKVLRVA